VNEKANILLSICTGIRQRVLCRSLTDGTSNIYRREERERERERERKREKAKGSKNIIEIHNAVDTQRDPTSGVEEKRKRKQ